MCLMQAQEELQEPEQDLVAAPSPRATLSPRAAASPRATLFARAAPSPRAGLSPRASPSRASSLARALSGRLVPNPVLSCLTRPPAGADKAEAVYTPYADSIVVNETPL